MKHFSKFIQPGAKRIVSSASRSHLLNTAFKNEDGNDGFATFYFNTDFLIGIMKMIRSYLLLLFFPLIFATNCGKKDTSSPPPPPPPPAVLILANAKLDNAVALTTSVNYNVRTNVSVRLLFNNALDRSSVSSSVSVKENGSTVVLLNYAYENNDSTLVITPSAPLKNHTRYNVDATTSLQAIKK